MDRKPTHGFTLIELLVAIAIAGILLGIGVPSFANAIKESRISSQYNTMVGSLYLARSEAVKGASQITVCPRKTAGAQICGDKDDWKNGWLVFIDRTTVQGETTAKIDADDEIIAVESELKGGNTIMAISSPTNTASNAGEVGFVRYLQTGGAQWSSGSVVVCDTERGADFSRSINVVLTGDIRRGRVAGDNTAPSDVFNRSISHYCDTP
ncbi:GspH/FimT family pseudopilin [Granulosicoccus antarcticus]|uniref:Type II secretion system protein H n=1 Tax=Granulosicoccus antarcticus IMCC3135 TaxID=1192854 RepID=A0A2Z2NXD0_9GAMM|nr:GspH/FimT family pseudopilin [Granulosicoccus antarcticus]ASJ72397.1 hypothetical protein IMCC3135_11535 [Granulosicoccus antarcticus IMCC3135]